ncbi:MAG: 3-deoxy-7-phosphoheptulonate synthase [Candidatus Omnitrophota bacterium]
MSFDYIRHIPTTEEIFAELPLGQALAEVKSDRDRQIREVFERKSEKFLLIIGPCSADNEDAVCEYSELLAKVQEEVREQLILIPRIYTNKPRTTGEGYKGMGHQPNPQEDPHIVDGLKAIRRMHIRVIRETGLTAADEMLYPGNYPYLEDVLSYVAIGARSVENQHHRLTVSGLDIPCGMKNPTSGDLTVMLNSIKAAQIPHTFSYNGWEVRTTGNPLAHAILRGAVNIHGQAIPNYHFEDMIQLADMYCKAELTNPTVIVDTNHANSDKKYDQQPRIAMEIMNSLNMSADLRGMVKGFMIESYLQEGRATIGQQQFGQSITDPCLGWEESRGLILDIADAIAGL